jgi:hypothetical protein
MNLACRREAEHLEPGLATKFGFQILASCGNHKGGKAAYRQAKNLCCISRISENRQSALFFQQATFFQPPPANGLKNAGQPRCGQMLARLGQNLAIFCNLMPKKPENNLEGIPPNKQSP